MSLKPVKKSDQNKSWMQPRRDRRKMIQPEYHLIVTEGTETEPPYFNAMRTIINANYPDKINVKVEGKGDNTLSLYYKAKDLAEKSANGLMRQHVSAKQIPTTKLHTMPYGQTNVWNSGFCSTSVLCNPIFIGVSTDQSSLKSSNLSERENTAKTATICTEFRIHTWMTLSSTPRSLKKSTKEKHHPNQPPVL